MIITPPYAVFDFSFKLCQDKDGSIRSRPTEITIHPDAKKYKCKFMQIINILFRKNGIYSKNTWILYMDAVWLCNVKEEKKMIQVGIIGATGYAGGELVRLLYGHKEA